MSGNGGILSLGSGYTVTSNGMAGKRPCIQGRILHGTRRVDSRRMFCDLFVLRYLICHNIMHNILRYIMYGQKTDRKFDLFYTWLDVCYLNDFGCSNFKTTYTLKHNNRILLYTLYTIYSWYKLCLLSSNQLHAIKCLIKLERSV
jgi:hypothetical protein